MVQVATVWVKNEMRIFKGVGSHLEVGFRGFPLEKGFFSGSQCRKMVWVRIVETKVEASSGNGSSFGMKLSGQT